MVQRVPRARSRVPPTSELPAVARIEMCVPGHVVWLLLRIAVEPVETAAVGAQEGAHRLVRVAGLERVEDLFFCGNHRTVIRRPRPKGSRLIAGRAGTRRS
jgi:hypothetical protein